MHRYAKQLLEREKRLLLGGLHVEEDGWSRPVIKEQVFAFDSVRLEEHLGEIVPDVILTKGGRELYVEIAVTHPCDAEKISKIERRGISTLEIDLSGYAYTDNQAEVDDIILHKARRRWVYHRNEGEVRQKLKADVAAKKAVEAEKHRQRVLKQLRDWVPQNADDWRSSVHVRNCIEAGLEEFIGLPIVGDQCFRASPKLWQAMLLDGRILSHKAYAVRQSGIDLLKASVWLADNRAVQNSLLAVPNAEDLAILRMENPGYRPPFEIVVEYVRFLEKHRLVYMSRSLPICMVSDELVEIVQIATEDRRQKKANIAYLDEAIRKLDHFIKKEHPSFDFDEWKATVQDRFGASFAQALDDTSIFGRMAPALNAVIEMLERRSVVAKYLLGLPIESQARAVSEEIEAASRIALQQAAIMSNARAEVTIKFAEEWLKNGDVWVREKQDIFNGKSAAEYAAESPEALLRVEREMNHLRYVQNNSDAEQFHKEQVRNYYRSVLIAAVTGVLGKGHRDVFLSTVHPELGVAPIDYVVDEPTFERVKRILMMYSARRQPVLVSRRHRRL